MWILPLVGYLGLAIGFSFLTLAIASGLYYLSELVEEHTVPARRILTRLIYAVIAIQFFLLSIDRFPIAISLLSIASHAVYGANLRHFPVVKLSDPVFILSCVLVFLNHILWFRHFSHPPHASHPSYNRYTPPDIPTFTEIASFFGICVWLVPFSLFISLSAGENVLPSMGSEYATGGDISRTSDGTRDLDGMGRQPKTRMKGLVRAGVDRSLDWMGETAEAMGLWKGERSRF